MQQRKPTASSGEASVKSNPVVHLSSPAAELLRYEPPSTRQVPFEQVEVRSYALPLMSNNPG